MADIAQKLGISDRHLRRVFESHWGITALQYRQTQRLLRAKQLLIDSDLPMAQIAALSGFSSVRRFNDCFHSHYDLSPSRLRQTGIRQTRPAADGTVSVRLDYRPPLDVQALLGFWGKRALKGIEVVDEHCLTRTIDLAHPRASNKRLIGWIQCHFSPLRPQLSLVLSESLLPGLQALIKRVREAFDLDADPQLIHQVLRDDFPFGEGLRVPGSFDGFELAVRAVLGQQVTVAAGRTFAQRIVDRFGTQLRLIGTSGQCISADHVAIDDLKLFPKPQAIAQASSDALGALGIVKQRQAALRSLAQAVIAGDLRLEPIPHDEAAIAHTIQVLCKLPGIGEWTAQYIAMRALRHRDALPAADGALHRAIGLHGTSKAKQQTIERSKQWSPWRSYAVIRAWHSLAFTTFSEGSS
jgi:AraC family transcriptional regulator of adaptative response / DNA-3-methyladenine glycosylase II